MTIDLLVKIYNQWGKRNNIFPLNSADDELFGNPNLTTKQRIWLERFIHVWEKLKDRSYPTPMKLHPIVTHNIMDEIQNLSELGGCESDLEYLYNLKYLLFKIQRQIEEAEKNMGENI